MCLYELYSKYVLGPNYAKILDIAVFSICESWSSEYILGSKCARILNMARF